jgi:hypothetical protein
MMVRDDICKPDMLSVVLLIVSGVLLVVPWVLIAAAALKGVMTD